MTQLSNEEFTKLLKDKRVVGCYYENGVLNILTDVDEDEWNMFSVSYIYGATFTHNIIFKSEEDKSFKDSIYILKKFGVITKEQEKRLIAEDRLNKLKSTLPQSESGNVFDLVEELRDTEYAQHGIH